MRHILNEIIHDHFAGVGDFASQMGVSRWTVQRWKADPTSIRVKYLMNISRLTGIPIENIDLTK